MITIINQEHDLVAFLENPIIDGHYLRTTNLYLPKTNLEDFLDFVNIIATNRDIHHLDLDLRGLPHFPDNMYYALLDSIAKNPNIEALYLNFLQLNKLDSEELNELKKLLIYHPGINQLQLGGNDLAESKEHFQFLIDIINGNPNLISLNIRADKYAKVDIKQFREFTEALANHPRLAKIDFNHNEIGNWDGERVQLFFNALIRNKNLMIIELWNNNLDNLKDSDFMKFIELLNERSKYEIIFGCNFLGQNKARIALILEAFRNNHSLIYTHIDQDHLIDKIVRNNFFSKDELHAILRSIQNNRRYIEMPQPKPVKPTINNKEPRKPLCWQFTECLQRPISSLISLTRSMCKVSKI